MYRFYRVCVGHWITSNAGRNSLISTLNTTTIAARENSYDTIRPRRAILYVPGHDRRKIEKLHSLKLDCAVLDCEDGVAVNKKSEARRVISEIASTHNFGKTEFAVRINSLDSGLAGDDLDEILTSKKIPDTLMVPKVDSVKHVEWINDTLKVHWKSLNLQNKISLILFIETAKGLLDLRKICERAVNLSQDSIFRFEGLVFGSDDFCADIGATRSEDAVEVLTARQIIVFTSKAFRLQAIDMVYINYKDLIGLAKSAKEGADMGFTGKQVIHPSQVTVVQKAFYPSPEKIAWAKELITLFKRHQKDGKGAFNFRGSMIDKPLLLQAENIVKVTESLDE
ncbi:citramalyl-CoA lyase, mitochondrial-like [Stegodyphus dumicola]|uniref:citramalyl-CoA lyase, mitochondrial-like n=1 Tax=Stegodyphus dumicola TaxID=202533 RepID=UPI0015B07A91|nr:citramalyl-CoA lyase, mitochondrial-like [Stegodyphus dumicola]